VSLQTTSEEGSKNLVPDPEVGDLKGDVRTEKGEGILSRGTEQREAEFGLNEVARRVDRTEGSARLESGLLRKTNVESVLEQGVGESSLSEESGASYVGGTTSEQVSKRVEDLGTFGGGLTSVGETSYRERAESIMRPYGGFQSYVAAKFKEYMRGGDVYLQEGKYYRAADSYTLASVYKSGSAVAEAGKSHALLAAGEYMSSSLFLMRAFDKFAESEAGVGDGAQEGSGSSVLLLFSSSFSLIDRDTLEKRVSDIEAWHEQTGSSELQFLLGYVYYQMGRYERAGGAIEAAYGDMGDVEAVRALKKAIESGPAK
jgi:tetratricopeptide (TPR) repeat protein